MKAFLNIVGLPNFLSCLTMGLTCKEPRESIDAIGSTEGIPWTLQRAVTPNKAFVPLPEAVNRQP
jgi:hypothetical protein